MDSDCIQVELGSASFFAASPAARETSLHSKMICVSVPALNGPLEVTSAESGIALLSGDAAGKRGMSAFATQCDLKLMVLASRPGQ